MKRAIRCGAIAIFLLGCSPDAANELAGRRNSSAGSRSSSSGGTSGGATDGGAAGADPKPLFEALEPDLAKTCGGSCHETGSGGAPTWLKGPDPYATVKAYPGIVSANAASSILLTKGGHEGPALGADMTTRVRAWLDAEAAQLAGTGPIETGDLPLPSGAASVDLPGNMGAKLTFTASMNAGVLQLKSVTVVAGSATGVHVAGVHLVFVHADGTETSDESFAGADVTVAKAESAPLDVGLVIVPHVVTTDKLRIEFDKLEAATGTADGGTTAPGGCKSVTAFQTNAAPQMTGTCTSCHSTGGSGFGALDLSGLTATTPDYARACAQAKNKIDTGNPASSDLILAPTGGVAAHPYKNASNAYVTAVTTWINAEK